VIANLTKISYSKQAEIKKNHFNPIRMRN